MEQQTILIVDDEELNLMLLEAFLESENYHVLQAKSGNEAIEIVEDLSPDLILLDVMMPGIDGFEVCRRLKQKKHMRMIPIVMVTALNEEKDKIAAMEAGADDFLYKPVDQTELILRVKSLLRIKTYHNDLEKSYNDIAKTNRKLKEVEKVKNGLLHMIIHDLNTPLSLINMTLDLILSKRNSLSNSQQLAIEKCISNCRDLSEMISGLLDVHKMEEGKLKPRRQKMDLKLLVNDLVDQFVIKARVKKISISCSNQEDLLPANIDPSLIKRVMVNLLSNAIRHIHAEGEIGVTTSTIPDNTGHLVSIKDNGDGLEKKYHKKVFEKFEQAELKRAGVKTGTSGLGLTFCKMAVEAHGGKIWVESDGEGKGCEFKFTIPSE